MSVPGSFKGTVVLRGVTDPVDVVAVESALLDMATVDDVLTPRDGFVSISLSSSVEFDMNAIRSALSAIGSVAMMRYHSGPSL